MSYLVFTVLLLALLAAGYKWQLWRLPRKGLLCLMYHHIGPMPPKNDIQYTFTILPEKFERHLDMLQKKGFTSVGLAELRAAKKTGKRLPKKPFLLTFDDGTDDSFTTLFPILQKRRLKALIFLVTDFIGKEPGYLTWDQVRQMQQSGLVDFGSHTASHARLRDLSDEKILQELTRSKQEIESQLHTPCDSFCYPFGSGSKHPRVRALVFQAGYEFDFGTRRGINPWPWKGKKTILRTFPRSEENMLDFYIQITRGKSKF